jgi:hypothetical protein
MPRQYSIDDIAKYKAGSGYGDWIANLMSIKEGGRMAPEYYIDGVPQYYNDVGGSGFGLENNILTTNKMPKKKFGNTDTQLFEGMLGGSMQEMGLDDMEGGAWHDWLQNLYDVIRRPKEALGSMPKPIWEHKNEYGSYGIVSIEICREPLSKGLQNIIDRASRGDLIKNLAKSPYEDLFHLYANVYLKNPLTGKTTSFRVEKNQRVEIFNKIVPPKGNSGKCMGVPNIPMKNGLPTIGWFKFWDNTDNTTWEYSANRFNCQAFLKTRLETLGLLTPALKEFIMQDIDTILDPVKNKFQISVAKGITNFANIMQNIYMGGEMGGDGHCGCKDQCGCGVKKGKGFAQPHKHDPMTWEVQPQYLEPNWWNYNRDYK